MAKIKLTSTNKYSLNLSRSEALNLKLALSTHIDITTKAEMCNRLITDKDIVVNLFESVLNEFFTRNYTKLSLIKDSLNLLLNRSEALALMQFLSLYDSDFEMLNIKSLIHKSLV
jgi:tRNA(Phe) wybutosine-synthesizing methylase Tyw3